ncbi:hypothetical protein CPAR01_01877 [Colletotrichum paranaense]|uniref:Uncharacterized protein n=1 Tax=Colletotrichum paranaense TaxID=1914294 RepID=A0ABQ9SXY0_9PEZI|nr:uncharacterized protein CPAR01_01877 [Colletotrichum paranaense]KAK1544375.1 hypothetical protein CPAR01_01877 [Colletotrichum paranaense]
MTKDDASRIQSSQARHFPPPPVVSTSLPEIIRVLMLAGRDSNKGGKDMSSGDFAARAQGAGDRNANAGVGGQDQGGAGAGAGQGGQQAGKK